MSQPKHALHLHRLAAIAVPVSAAGLVSWLWSVPTAIAITGLALWLSIEAMLRYNVPLHAALTALLAFDHALCVYWLTRSEMLATASLAIPLTMVTWQGLVRRLGYRSLLFVGVGLGAEVALLALANPPSMQWLVLVPTLAMGVWLSLSALKLVRALVSRPGSELRVGEPVPDFRLPVRGGGADFVLSEQRGSFVFVHFMRSDWCPVCQVMLRFFRKANDQLASKNVKLVVISPSAGPEAEAFAVEMGMDYTLLMDPEHATARRFGIFDPAGNDGKGSVLPVGFLIGPDGTLRHASRPSDASNFLDPDKVLELVTAG